MSINTAGQNKRLCEYVILHAILGGSPVILWISLGGKPKWLPLKFGYHDVMRTSPIAEIQAFKHRRGTGASQDRSLKEKRKGRVLQAHAKISPRAEFLVGKYECIESKAHLDSSCKGALKILCINSHFFVAAVGAIFFNAPFSCARPKKRRHPCHAHLKLCGGRAQTGTHRSLDARFELHTLVRVNTGTTVSNCFY